MIFVVGATGLVGSTVCKGLVAKGQKVRALVRTTSDPAKVKALTDAGVATVTGDLKDEASLRAAIEGADIVISTASATLSRAEGDSIESVDQAGQIRLIDVAKAAGVKQLVYVSFPEQGIDSPLATAKRAVESHLRSSGMAYTILQPYFFAEVWLSPALGFDVANGKARIYGSGENKISWISFLDVASAVVASAGNAKTHNKVIELGGPTALSPLEVVRIFEELSKKKIEVEHVPEEALRGQVAGAPDPMSRSFAALMLSYALGYVIDNAPAVEAIGFEPTPVRTIAARLLGVSEVQS